MPLAKLLCARGEFDEALTVLAPVAGSFAADGLRARIELERGDQPDLATAFAAFDGGDAESALDELLGALPAAGSARDTVRRAIVGILDELGSESELAPQRPPSPRDRALLTATRGELPGQVVVVGEFVAYRLTNSPTTTLPSPVRPLWLWPGGRA